MGNDTQIVHTTLEHKLIGEIRGTFFVPSYQRGYRWDTDDVQRLLDDIWNCGNQLYSLQPVVVKCKKGKDGLNDEWELIDGQQRLTTLYLIFRYMKEKGWKKPEPPYSINYETRPNSKLFLEDIEKIGPEKHENNIDYFHLYQAYKCIDQWFVSKGDDHVQENVVADFKSYLTKFVRVIWYETPDNENSIALFTRLNVGRIPLTDAELIKALLLSILNKTHAERAQEFAAQWDGIERDLQNPNIWAFVAGADMNEDVDKYPTRISLLFDTLADILAPIGPGGKRPRYRTFETLRKDIQQNSIINFWNGVIELHDLILGWFANPNLYNKIGFLVATGDTFGTLVQLSRNKKKSDFDKFLIENIRSKINVYGSKLIDLSYDKDRSTLLNLLLLMNVETVSRTGQHFPFRMHVGKTWSLEHIHAQNTESLTTKDQWKSWLEAHQKALGTLPNQQTLLQDIDAALQIIHTDNNFGIKFQHLATKVVNVFTLQSNKTASNHRLHSISNIALLSSDNNSALSNAVFEVKRQIVLEIDRNMDGKKDCYIPVCTRNVFLKYYAEADAQQIHFWSPQDRESYYKAICFTLKDYLK